MAGFLTVAELQGGRRTIDGQHSVITVRVYKSGLFSIFAHDHEITTSIARGEIEDGDHPSVEFWVDAGKLRVIDSELSAKDRAEVQRTMEGPKVLDVSRFPEIHFRSTTIQKMDADHWIIRGDLDLHGKTHPVAVEVTQKDGHFVGSAALKQTDFGISPVRIAGGTVRVKDQVKAEFEIVTMR
ncbi:MAG: YceI family protein [Acidobacteria bacterium]|nr:YceI family protein [Acidobacteriota bacterium]